MKQTYALTLHTMGIVLSILRAKTLSYPTRGMLFADLRLKKKTLGMCRNTEIGYMDISYMCVSIHVITCDYMCVFIEILVFMLFPSMYYCGWLRNPAPVDRWFIKGFNHPRWCRISSIHSMSVL